MQQQAAIMAASHGGYLTPSMAFPATQIHQMGALNINSLQHNPMNPMSSEFHQTLGEHFCFTPFASVCLCMWVLWIEGGLLLLRASFLFACVNVLLLVCVSVEWVYFFCSYQQGSFRSTCVFTMSAGIFAYVHVCVCMCACVCVQRENITSTCSQAESMPACSLVFRSDFTGEQERPRWKTKSIGFACLCTRWMQKVFGLSSSRIRILDK